MPLRIGITLGDPAGIGPEIIRSALESGKLTTDIDYKVIGQVGTLGEGSPSPESALAELNQSLLTSQQSLSRFTGPHPPDTLFFHLANEEWDAALCMYHDQGLIPLKLHAFHSGVNVTLGLPFPRTSPDHGTAFDIAGKGIAHPDSMIAAINLAAELAQKQT